MIEDVFKTALPTTAICFIQALPLALQKQKNRFACVL